MSTDDRLVPLTVSGESVVLPLAGAVILPLESKVYSTLAFCQATCVPVALLFVW
jgi:hypothetical protein